MNKGPSGFGIDVESALMGAMSGVDHDLVVPPHSALSFGSPKGAFMCSHIAYFSDAAVKAAIWAFIGAVAAVGTPSAAVPGPQISQAGNTMWIGNVGLPIC